MGNVMFFLGKHWKKIAILVIASIAFAWGVRIGSQYTEAQWSAKWNEREAELARQEAKTQELIADLRRKTGKIEVRYIERVKKIEGEVKEIVREVPVAVTQDYNERCSPIPNGVVDLHNRLVDLANDGVINNAED